MDKTSTRTEQFAVSMHRHSNWTLRGPARAVIPLDTPLNARELQKLPKARVRIQDEYERLGRPRVTPSVVSAIAEALHLAPGTVERELLKLPGGPSKAVRPQGAPAAPPSIAPSPALTSKETTMTATLTKPSTLTERQAHLWDAMVTHGLDPSQPIPHGQAGKLAAASGCHSSYVKTAQAEIARKVRAEGRKPAAAPVPAPVPIEVEVTELPIESTPLPIELAPQSAECYAPEPLGGLLPAPAPTLDPFTETLKAMRLSISTFHAVVAEVTQRGVDLSRRVEPPLRDEIADAVGLGRASLGTYLAAARKLAGVECTGYGAKSENGAPEPVNADSCARTFEEGVYTARVEYAESEGCRTGRGWVFNRLKHPATTDYERGYQEGLRQSIAESDAAAALARPLPGLPVDDDRRSEASQPPAISVEVVVAEGDFESWRSSLLARQEARAKATACIPSGWTPTADALNALPDPLRAYIHDLETRCDPAGDTAALALLRENCRGLESERERLEREVTAAHAELDRLGVPADDGEVVEVRFTLAERVRGLGERTGSFPVDWEPTPEQLAALPKRLREYLDWWRGDRDEWKRRAREAADVILEGCAIPDDWEPTLENLAALPEPVRRYIEGLHSQTQADMRQRDLMADALHEAGLTVEHGTVATRVSRLAAMHAGTRDANETLLRDLELQREECDRLTRENARFREALEYYADEAQWDAMPGFQIRCTLLTGVATPGWDRARKALGGTRVLEAKAKAETCEHGHWYLPDLQGKDCPLCRLAKLRNDAAVAARDAARSTVESAESTLQLVIRERDEARGQLEQFDADYKACVNLLTGVRIGWEGPSIHEGVSRLLELWREEGDRLLDTQVHSLEWQRQRDQARAASSVSALPSRLTRLEIRTALALLDEATGAPCELWEGIATPRIPAVFTGAAQLAQTVCALEEDGGQG